MLKALALEFGTGITLFLICWMIEKIVKQFRSRTSEQLDINDQTKIDNQSAGSAVSNLLSTISPYFPGDYQGIAGGETEISSMCAESGEALSSIGEGVQSLLEGAGEHLGSLGESIGNIISGS